MIFEKIVNLIAKRTHETCRAIKADIIKETESHLELDHYAMLEEILKRKEEIAAADVAERL